MMNRWRLWSGITSCVLAVGGYVFLVVLCAVGVIPINLDMVNMDIQSMMEAIMSDKTGVYTLLGYSGELTELLLVAGIVSIVTHRKSWYCNIPVAAISGYAAVMGFMGYKYLYPVAAWAALCLFMSIVAMRNGRRAAKEAKEAPAEEPAAPAPQPSYHAEPMHPAPAPERFTPEMVRSDAPAEPVKAAPAAPAEPTIPDPPRATAVDDYEE